MFLLNLGHVHRKICSRGGLANWHSAVPAAQWGDGGCPEAFTKRGAQLEEVLRRLGLEELLEDRPCHIPKSWDGTDLGDFSVVVWMYCKYMLGGQ